jgi:hypothetical protein
METPGVETLVSLRRRVLVVGARATPSCSCQPNKNLRHPTNDLHSASFIQLCDLAKASQLLLPRHPNVTGWRQPAVQLHRSTHRKNLLHRQSEKHFG